jgi:hypothetical protein
MFECIVLAAHVRRHRPAFCSRKIPTICSSVNRLGFMSIPLRGDGLYPFLEEFSGLMLLFLVYI